MSTDAGFPHRKDGGAYGRAAKQRQLARQRMAAVDPSESTRRMLEAADRATQPIEPDPPKAA
jgi:hypothetical protein